PGCRYGVHRKRRDACAGIALRSPLGSAGSRRLQLADPPCAHPHRRLARERTSTPGPGACFRNDRCRRPCCTRRVARLCPGERRVRSAARLAVQHTMTSATYLFESQRKHLFGIAYRMLGEVAGAEDIVQEAWLRWRRVDAAEVRDPRAWLSAV